LTRLDAALLTMNGSPNRRTLQFATMSGNIALSDMMRAGMYHVDFYPHGAFCRDCGLSSNQADGCRPGLAWRQDSIHAPSRSS
jgi:hypothetical protein